MENTTWRDRFDKGVSNLLDNTSERDRDIYFAFKDFIATEIEIAYNRGYYEGEKNEFHNQAGRIEEAKREKEQEIIDFIAKKRTYYLGERASALDEILAALQAPDLSDKE